MNEMWASEVERQLRLLQAKFTGLNQNDLRLQGFTNFGLPVSQPPTGTNEDEVYWIRLTGKTVIGGVNIYSWRRQVYVMTGGGMAWVDSGDSGTFSENPAIGLNNEDRSTTDGKRYPAKYNADTSQWIFFLTLNSSGGGGGGGSYVAECRIRLISGVHFPGGSASTWTDWNTPNLLRFWNTTTEPTCAVLAAVDNPTFGYAIMQWATLPYHSETSAYVYWRLPTVSSGVNAEVRLDKSDWSIQGAISYQESSGFSGTQTLFAINWNLESSPSPRMTDGTTGSATLSKATSSTSPFAIKTISDPPPVPGYVYSTLVQYTDSNSPLCSWGGTNPVIEVEW